jgi:hypothetical protein
MKKLDDEGNYTYLTAGELKAILADIPDETEVKIRTCHTSCGNIVEAGTAEMSSYGFFGNDIPCLIIEPAYNGHVIDERARKRRFAFSFD